MIGKIMADFLKDRKNHCNMRSTALLLLAEKSLFYLHHRWKAAMNF